MKKIYYILPIVLLVMNVLSGCTDSEEEQGPVVVEVDDEEMVRQGWKWAVALDNDLRMQCSPDIVNGGYVMQMTDMDSYDAVFVFDDKCRVREACINSVWYYFFVRDNTLNVSYLGDSWMHESFDFNVQEPTSGNPFEKMTENLKAVYKTVSLLPMPVKTNINDLFAAVDRGEYNTSSAPDDDADIKNFCEVVYYYEAWNQDLRDDLFGKGLLLHYKHERTTYSNKIGIALDPVNNKTFNRGYGSGRYGEEMDNKVYCGLVFGSSPDVALGNCEYKTNLVPAEPEDGYVWVDVPENMESKAYYVRAFMVSEQEKDKVERGEYIPPHFVRFEKDGPDNLKIFYGGEIVMDNFVVVNEPVVDGALKVNLSGNLSVPDYLSESGFELNFRLVGDHSGEYVNIVSPGKIDEHISIWKNYFKEFDTENFIARGYFELSVNVGWVCLGVVPFTVVYDKKPYIRYTGLTHDGMSVKIKRKIDGALWFDDDVNIMWETPKGPVECSSYFASEGESEYSEDIDDTNLISYQRKASGEYMEVTIDGKTLRSNRLIFERDADGIRTNIYLEE